MTGFDPIFGIMGYHLMLRYNRVRYNGVDFVLCKLAEGSGIIDRVLYDVTIDKGIIDRG